MHMHTRMHMHLHMHMRARHASMSSFEGVRAASMHPCMHVGACMHGCMHADPRKSTHRQGQAHEAPDLSLNPPPHTHTHTSILLLSSKLHTCRPSTA